MNLEEYAKNLDYYSILYDEYKSNYENVMGVYKVYVKKNGDRNG